MTNLNPLFLLENTNDLTTLLEIGKPYSFLGFFKHSRMCDRAERLANETLERVIQEIKKLKSMWEKGLISQKEYQIRVSKNQDILARLQIRLDKIGLMPIYS